MSKKTKVLVIGWDAAEWKVIDKLIDGGYMPTFKKFLQEGTRGRLATLDPPLSPMLWTSMATGVRPYKHGILGFVEPDPTTGKVRPVSTKSRKVKAIWNILNQNDYTSNVVGWWPSNPVEPINGCMVSNLYQTETKGYETIDIEKWEMPEGTVHPERLKETLKELRVHPLEITGNLIMPFVPNAIEQNRKDDPKLYNISKFIAHATSLHAACTELMINEPADFTAVYHDAIDHFGHTYMKFYPPKLETVSDEDFELFNEVIKGAYMFHDMMLERLLKLVDDETTVIICSDHGFHSDHLRPRVIPNNPIGPAIEHGPYGIFAVKGPGIKKGASIYGASILDLTPTLLSIYDLPIGQDMDGKPLVEIFEKPKKIRYIESWEKVAGNTGELSTDFKEDPMAHEAAMQQLIDLGYINAPDLDDDIESLKKETITENNFYLAKSYANGGKLAEAKEVLESIIVDEKVDFRYIVEMLGVCIGLKDYEKGEYYLQMIKDQKIIDANFINIYASKIKLGLNKPQEAIHLLEQSMEKLSFSAEINIELAKVYLSVNELDKAEILFKKAVEIDHLNAHAYNGLGYIAIRKQEYEKAVEFFLESIELIYHYPMAHFHLGEALVLYGDFDNAEKAFQTVVTIAPKMKKTYKWLLDISKLQKNVPKTAHYQAIWNTLSQGHITVITGLPSNQLENSLKLLVENDKIEPSEMEDLFGQNINKINEEYLNTHCQKIIYVPLKMLGTLLPQYDYTIYFIESTINDSVVYCTEKFKTKETEYYNMGFEKGLHKQSDLAFLWMSQQPELDVYYTNNLEKLLS
jgi:predicted AlkP superfamily phosphohydrolase/phosphomutase/tetratricopeptide (TPR) repeat protein